MPAIPTEEVILGYLGKWSRLENYRAQEASLGLLFREFCPENKKIEHILLKVCALNDFYSTNIFDTYSVSKHILAADIDARLAANDGALVNEIAQVSLKNGAERNFYSFASKYCSHHNPDSFPIYDSFVEKMMLHYSSKGSFKAFKKEELRNYPRFIEIIKSFRQAFGLARFTLREIDIYLWLAGKEFFPRKY